MAETKAVKPKREKRAAKKSKGLTRAEVATLKKLLAKAEGSGIRIDAPRLKHEGQRERKVPRNRGFWHDGVHAYLRRRTANTAIIERTDARIRRGEYRHVRTSDDVEVYEIADWSTLRRKRVNFGQLSDHEVEQHIVKAACAHDWRLYHDAVSEYAYRFKNSDLPQDQALKMLQTAMRYLELRIMRRGGPTSLMIQHELAGIRKERTGTQLFLPH